MAEPVLQYMKPEPVLYDMMPEPMLVDFEMPEMDIDYSEQEMMYTMTDFDYSDPEMMYTMTEFDPSMEPALYDMVPEAMDKNFTIEDAIDMIQNGTDFESIAEDAGVELDFDMQDLVNWNQQEMRGEFRDYFGYAIMGDMWDESKPSKCDEGCNAEYEMCCVQVAMQDKNSQVTNYESYCMTQDSAMEDMQMAMSGYDIKMTCDKNGKPPKGQGKGPMGMMGNASMKLASGIISAAVVIFTLY